MVRIPVSLALFLLLGFTAYWSARITYADHLARNSPDAIESAISLTPLRAEYWTHLSEVEDLRGKDARPALTVASQLNPNDPQIWTDLALREETAGNLAAAERDLFKAASVSTQFDPRWSLANYFSRRNDDRFWHWIHEAFLMSYGDRRPLFQLCWNFSTDPKAILSRAIPDDNQILDPYLAFLLGYDRFAAAEPVARQILPRASAPDKPILLSFCSRFLVADQPGPALTTWNALAARRLIPYLPLDPEKGVILTNGDFGSTPLAQGFDWKPTPPPSASISRTPGELTITLDGHQPENCELLTQILPLNPALRYELRFEYQTSGILPGSGLSWKLLTFNGAELLTRSPHLSSDVWKSERVEFGSLGSRSRFARLTLAYRRPTGKVRIEGSLALRNMRADLIR